MISGNWLGLRVRGGDGGCGGGIWVGGDDGG